MTERTDVGTSSPRKSPARTSPARTSPDAVPGAVPVAGARERRPWTPVELGLLLSLVYLLLLISLAGTRIGKPAAARPTAAGPAAPEAVRLVARIGPPPAGPSAEGSTGSPSDGSAGSGSAGSGSGSAANGSAGSAAETSSATDLAATCVGPNTQPRSYAGEPGVEVPLAFGPPVDGAVETVNGTLIQRLCGGIPQPGQPARPPDRRLFVALDAVVNGRDPNRAIPRAEWAAGVDAFITRDARWTRARIVTREAPAGTRTYGMRVRPGQDPLVEPTRLRTATRSTYLVLPVRRAAGGETVLTLRLACGFQPTFPPA